jgi:hypothetical protein
MLIVSASIEEGDMRDTGRLVRGLVTRVATGVTLLAGRDRPGPAGERVPGAQAGRPDRDYGTHVVRRKRDQLRHGPRGLSREGFRTVHARSLRQLVQDLTISAADAGTAP